MLKLNFDVPKKFGAVVIMGLLVGLLAITAVACGSDDEEEAAAPAAPAADKAPAAAAKAEPTKAPPTAVPPKEGGGTLIVANDLIGPRAFRPSVITGGAHSAVGLQDWGMYDFLLRADYSAPPTFGEGGGDGLATEWTLDRPGNKITFTIRDDAKWNCDEGGGMVDAHDIVYSFTESMKEGTKSTRGPGLKTWMESWEATDDRTAVVPLVPGKLPSDWMMAIGNHGGGSIPIVSKKLADLGGDKDLTTFCGSGPFHITSWTSEEEVVAAPVPDNYRAKPNMIDELRVVQIAEANAKVAALKTGEVHMANLPLKFTGPTNDAIDGSWLQPVGKYQPQTVYFAGNFWARTSYGFDDPPKEIFPREGLKADAAHPWIGNPDDDESMENARKVRWALSMAIDRESLTRNVFNGLGGSTYTYTDVMPDHERFNPEWKVEYDVEGAKKLLAEAGVPDGFEMDFWVSPDNTAAVDPEAFEAIAQMWQDIGVNASIEKTVYAARRPTLVARSIDIPFAHHTFFLTIDQPKGGSLVPTGGFNHGVELPEEIGQLRYANETETDLEQRIQNNLKMQDYLSHWQLMASTVTLQPTWTVRPEVADWKPHQQAWGMFNSPETVKMKK